MLPARLGISMFTFIGASGILLCIVRTISELAIARPPRRRLYWLCPIRGLRRSAALGEPGREQTQTSAAGPLACNLFSEFIGTPPHRRYYAKFYSRIFAAYALR